MSQFIEMFGNPLSSIQKNELKKLGDCCQINPRRPSVSISDNDLVSFVPMPAVNEDGYIDGATNDEYGKVKKGFTYFENNDVLFAKITPCMENGKGAIAEGLTNGIGMGSTEFHILRPIEGISNSYWLLALTRMPIFREQAAKNMSGTGGQRRVGAAFLENFMIGLPSYSEQKRFETIYKQADKSEFVGCKSQFIEMFGTGTPKHKISDVCEVKGGSTPSRTNALFWDNGDVPWFTVEDIYTQGKYIRETKQHITKLATKKCFVYPKDTVLICCTASIGECALAKIEMASNQHFNGMIIKDRSKLEPQFLLYVSSTLKEHLLRQAGKTTIHFVSRTKLEEILIPVPMLDKQRQFVEIMEQADKSEFELRKSIEAIDQVIKSFINDIK